MNKYEKMIFDDIHKMPLDEYGLEPILARCDVSVKEVLPLLNEQLDKVCGSYMMNSDEIKNAAFTEVKCCLLKAMIDSEDDDQLKSRIEEIIKAM